MRPIWVIPLKVLTILMFLLRVRRERKERRRERTSTRTKLMKSRMLRSNNQTMKKRDQLDPPLTFKGRRPRAQVMIHPVVLPQTRRRKRRMRIRMVMVEIKVMMPI